MLPALLRYDLRQDADFFRRARSLRSPYWTFLWSERVTDSFNPASTSSAPSQSPLPVQFAVIVKKTVARGVGRSQLKRLVKRAIIDALASSTQPKQGSYAVVLIPRHKVKTATHVELVLDLTQSLTTLTTPQPSTHSKQ